MLDQTTLAIATAFLAAICLAGSYFDGRERRLPNWLSLAAWVGGLVIAGLVGGIAAVPSHLGHSLIALVGGMALFRFGMIGAGDAKFYAGLAAWFSLSAGLMLFLSVALAGVVLVVAMMILSRIRRQTRTDRRKSMSELPYGIAIAIGAAVSWSVKSGLLELGA